MVLLIAPVLNNRPGTALPHLLLVTTPFIQAAFTELQTWTSSSCWKNTMWTLMFAGTCALRTNKLLDNSLRLDMTTTWSTCTIGLKTLTISFRGQDPL